MSQQTAVMIAQDCSVVALGVPTIEGGGYMLVRPVPASSANCIAAVPC